MIVEPKLSGLLLLDSKKTKAEKNILLARRKDMLAWNKVIFLVGGVLISRFQDLLYGSSPGPLIPYHTVSVGPWSWSARKESHEPTLYPSQRCGNQVI